MLKACASCLTAERARELACAPWVEDLPSSERTAGLLVPYLADGPSPRRVIEFSGPVLILGVHATAMDSSGGQLMDVAPMLMVRLDIDGDTGCITAGARGEAPFVALRSIDLSVRALNLVLSGPNPEIGVTIKPIVGNSNAPAPIFPVALSFIYRPIGR